MCLARESELSYVPAVCFTSQRITWVEQAGRFWDLTTWMPGKADFHDRPSGVRLEAACEALARLHTAWSSLSPTVGRCPGIIRRLDSAARWASLVSSGWNWRTEGPPREGTEEEHGPLSAAKIRDLKSVRGALLDPLAERAWLLVAKWVEWLPKALAGWLNRPVPLQPCLCDVWHDHVLFEGDVVSGVIDHGGVKVDHVAVDIARLLGSMIGDDAELRAIGLTAYKRHRSLSSQEEELVTLLDRTGTIIGMSNWLKWLYHDGKYVENLPAAARRLAELVDRVERWDSLPRAFTGIRQ
jgi:homoserine kinase type II